MFHVYLILRRLLIFSIGIDWWVRKNMRIILSMKMNVSDQSFLGKVQKQYGYKAIN